MNEVEIVVVGKDDTGRVFASVNQKARTAGAKAGREFGDGFHRDSNGRLHDSLGRFVGDGAKIGVKAGSAFGTALANGVGSTFKSLPPQAQAGIVAGVAAAGAIAAPFLGSVLAGAVIGGAGIGGIIGGILLVKDDPRVQAVGSEVGKRITSSLKLRAEPIVQPLIDGMRIFEARVLKSGDSFGKVFQNVSKFIAPLADTAGSLVDHLADGMAALTSKAAPVMRALNEGMEFFGESVEKSMTALSEVGPEGALALKVALVGAGIAAMSIAGAVLITAKAFGALIRLGETVAKKIPGDSIMEALGRELDGFEETVGGVEAAYNGLANSADQARSAMQGVSDVLRAQTDPAFALIEAQRGLSDAQAAAADATKKYGANSRQAADANIALAKAALQMQGAAESAGTAFNGAMTPALRATLRAAHLTEAQIDSVERSMRSAANAGKAFGRGYVARVSVLGLGGVQGAAGAARRAIAAIPSQKNVYINVIARGSGLAYRASGGNVSGAEGAGVATAATGGQRGGMVLVGEAGPELVRLPFGSSVIPNGQTQRMMSEGSKGGDGAVQVVMEFAGNLDSAFATAFMKLQQAGQLRFKAQYVTG